VTEGSGNQRSKGAHALAWTVLLLAVAAIYWPGLHGGFIFDDFPFLIDNPDLAHVTSLDPAAWTRAVLSFPANHQGRWLTMFSFAVNHYFTGFDPFWFKLTNLAIHLLNGWLLYRVARGLLALVRATHPERALSPATAQTASLLLAAAWLVLPINLTGVLYAVQRLESLSNTFVFLGLALYLHGRVRLESDNKGFGWMIGGLAAGGVGLLAKESAVLLPLYTFLVEWVFGGFRAASQRRRIITLYAVVLGLPLLAGLWWLGTWIGTGTSYARDFDTWERLLTEARVLFAYMQWTLLPFPRSLSLYHDDFALSHGLLSPVSTLFSVLGILALLAIAAWQRGRRPLLSLGILWFFAGHALTATIIPLELVFEHRNYFPSFGLLLAASSLLGVDSPGTVKPRIGAAVAVSALIFYGFSTHLRAREWGHPIRLALAEASISPTSPRAQYELGRALLITARGNPDSPAWTRARQAFEDCRKLPNSSVLCEQGLIMVASLRKEPVDPSLWTSIITKLRASTPTSSDATAMTTLFDCQLNDICAQDFVHLGDALQAGIDHPQPNDRMLTLYGQYAWLLMGDLDLAERIMRDVIAIKPQVPDARANLISVLIENGRIESARAEYAKLEKMNHLGSIDAMLASLRKAMESASTANPELRN